MTPDALLPVGTKIPAVHFVPGQLVDVCGTSKGKGFQGVMKRWNFGGGPASHGNSLSHRVPVPIASFSVMLSFPPQGSTGCRQDPGRTFKNKKMPGILSHRADWRIILYSRTNGRRACYGAEPDGPEGVKFGTNPLVMHNLS